MPRLRTTFSALAANSLLACVAPTNNANGPIRPYNPSCVAPLSTEVPERLSQLDCFDAEELSKAGPGLIAYAVNAPLWSDHADKQRWLALPEGQQLSVAANGQLVPPVGSMLFKLFERDGVPLETRVWMNHQDVGWRGYSYMWLAADGGPGLAAATGAELDTAEGDWSVPSRSQCVQCHAPGPFQNLGLSLAQLDRRVRVAGEERSVDQLDTWSELGILAASTEESALHVHEQLVDYRDEQQPLELRARSYLHANCSSCHNSARGYCTGDLRAGTALEAMGVCEQEPRDWQPSWDWPKDTRLLRPSDPSRSAIWLRMRAEPGAPEAMPPLGRHSVDEAGVALIAEWIRSLSSCEQQ